MVVAIELLGDAGDMAFEPKPAKQSTEARPGSDEKVEVLRRRVEQGEELWHPDDHYRHPMLPKLLVQRIARSWRCN